MIDRRRNKPSLAGFGPLDRRPVDPAAGLVSVSAFPGMDSPVVATPRLPGVDLAAWAAGNRDWIDAALHRSGAVLFREFALTAESFAAVVRAVGGTPVAYRERSSPRTAVAGFVYTSTEYPADQRILQHNENSYAHQWPGRVFFFCETPPATGGETPLTDTRRVLARLPRSVREEFHRRKLLYVRNFGGAVGLPWRDVFQVADRREADDYFRRVGYVAEWLPGDRLRVRRIGEALARHPVTGESVWFNHAAFFHVSSLPAALRSALTACLAAEDLPNCVLFGDGGVIPDETVAVIREAYDRETVTFDWRAGDLLVLDNMVTAHGRAPFAGPRRILAAMTDPLTAGDERVA